MLVLHSTAPLAAFTVHCLQWSGHAVCTNKTDLVKFIINGLQQSIKGKDAVVLRMELRRGAHLALSGHWTRRWIYHWVCDAWPLRRQTYGYLPNQWLVPISTAWWTEAHCVWTTYPESLRKAERSGRDSTLRPPDCKSDTLTTTPQRSIIIIIIIIIIICEFIRRTM